MGDRYSPKSDCLPICYDKIELSCNKRSNTIVQITLSQSQSEVLETLVKQGQYPSLEEAINTALLLLIDDVALPDADRSPEYLVWAEATRKKIDIAREQAQRGEVLEANVVLAQLRAKMQSAKEVAV
jgi:antitoxin ParD1/3/4